MGERRALVIASQCEGLNLLSFLPEAASDVAGALLDPAIGGCVPALPGRALLIDPTVDQLDDAVTEAFARASEDEATLFVALVGHGEYTADDFYFLTRDTKLPPSSRTAFMLAQRVKELLARYSMLDGLVLLLDTCHAGIAAKQAASRWLDIVSQAGRRFEVLTASDDRTAANGCFSRQLVQVLRSGHARLGERLRCPDLKTVLSTLCPMQTAVHLAYDGRHVIEAGDEGLWLAMNTSDAWRASPAADNPAAAEIERLTRDYQPPHQLAKIVSNVLTGTGYVAVVGPARSGKSRLIAALARPSVAERTVPPKLMDAVIFLSANDTAERVAAEIARQLTRSVPWFAEAAAKFQAAANPAVWQAADAFERAVFGPVSARRAKIRIAVDGIDALPRPFYGRLRQTLEAQVAKGTLQLVMTSRQTLPAPQTVWLELFDLEDILDVGEFRGGPATFPGGIPATSSGGGPARPTSGKKPDRDLIPDILNAAGKAHLPTTVLAAATGLSVRAVRDHVVAHSADISRRNAGTATETVTRFTDGPAGTTAAHDALATALATLAPISERSSATPEQIYADAAEAEHCWQAGRHTEALRSLQHRAPTIPAEARALWEHWTDRITAALGPESPLTIAAEARLLDAVSETGDRAGALAGFQDLLPVAVSALGPEDPRTLGIRDTIARLALHESGRPAGDP